MESNVDTAREFPRLRLGTAAALAVALVWGLLPQPAAAQDGTAGVVPESTLERRLADLNSTLERIARLLEQQLKLQQTDLFYRRLEVLDSSLSSDRRALREARERMRQEEAEAKNLELMLEQFEQQTDALDETDENLPFIRTQLEQMKGRQEILRDSRRELTVHVAELESRIQRREEDLAALHEELSDS